MSVCNCYIQLSPMDKPYSICEPYCHICTLQPFTTVTQHLRRSPPYYVQSYIDYESQLNISIHTLQDKNVWLVHMLEKKDELPVVAFTLSRNRCNDNADSLSSLNLTTTTEKSEIHVFFKKSISLLKGSDQKLPQVCMYLSWEVFLKCTHAVVTTLLVGEIWS